MPVNNSLNMSSATAGLQSQPASGISVGRSIAITTSQFAISNSAGASGNPVLSFATAAHMSNTQPIVLAYRSSVTAAVTGNGTVYTVIFDTITSNAGSNYNNTTGIFTAPVDGNYNVMGNVGFRGFGTSTSFTSYIVSTSNTLPCQSNAAFNIGLSAIIWCPFKGTLRLSASDTIRIQAVGAGGTLTNTIFGGAAYATYLTISLVN